MCHSPSDVGCAKQRLREGRRQGPSPPGLARLRPRTTVRVPLPGCFWLCQAAREGEVTPHPPGISRYRSCTAWSDSFAVGSAEGEEAGPPPAGPHPARAVHCLCMCRDPEAVGCAKQLAGGGPFQPGLAGLGPRNACACVAAGTLTDVSSNEKGWQGPSYRDSPGSGRAPPCACVAAMTLLAVPSSERGRGSAPPRRASPGSGSAPPVRVAAMTLSAVPSTVSSERKEADS